MLRYARIANSEEGRKLADGALLFDELADDHQAMGIGQRLEQLARSTGRTLHGFGCYFHSCEDTHIRIYVKLKRWKYRDINEARGPPAFK